ncbi:MAG: cytochrome c [Gemmatimonadetes bacterium]|nr:cytochrome c [Gemmatimonadota bacterium]
MSRKVGRFSPVLTLALITYACGGGEPAPQGEMAPSAAPPTQTSAAAPMGALPEGVTAEMVTQGQQIFTGAGLCYTCHGPDGTGTPLAPNLTDVTWINVDGSYEAIVGVVTSGVAQPEEHPAPMPPLGGAQLTPDQVRAVAAYVYSRAHGG